MEVQEVSMDRFAISVLRAGAWIYLALSVVAALLYLYTSISAAMFLPFISTISAITGVFGMLLIIGQGLLIWALLRVVAYCGDSISWLVDVTAYEQEIQ